MNQQLALAGWTHSARRDDDSVHRRVDDVLFAERASVGMVKEIEFDGAHGGIVPKKVFAYLSPGVELASYATRED